MPIAILLQILFSLSTALAGGTVSGNSGNGVVCQNGSAEVLDVYELQFFQKNRSPELGAQDIDHVQKVKNVLQKLKLLSPWRSEKYSQRLVELIQNMDFTDDKLVDIPDTHEVVLPHDCEIQKIAIQTKVNGARHLLVNHPIWRKLNEDNKAALLLHEIVYSEAIDYGSKDSIDTRYFTGVLMTLPSNIAEFAERIGVSQFPIELPLPSGDTVFLLNPSLELLKQSFAGRVQLRSVCGIRLGEGKALDFCGLWSDSAWAVLIDGRVVAFAPNNALNLTRIRFDGSLVGLPFEIYGFDLTQSVFWPTANILVDGQKASCPSFTAVVSQPDLLVSRLFRPMPTVPPSCYLK